MRLDDKTQLLSFQPISNCNQKDKIKFTQLIHYTIVVRLPAIPFKVQGSTGLTISAFKSAPLEVILKVTEKWFCKLGLFLGWRKVVL